MAFLVMEPMVDARGAAVIRDLPAALIRPNPAQPRRIFEEESLAALADSIRTHGILQPPVVRETGDGFYELIAGERRYRAALLCGMETIPCVVRTADEEESAELAVIENLHRKDLDMFEEAEGLALLIDRYRLTQEQIGERLSMSQSGIANKLRLLRLSEEARAILRGAGMTERHARAVLRLPEEKRLPALRHMAENGMNVAAAERYVERLLTAAKPRSRHTGVIKDIRLFYNSVDRAVRLVRESGIGVASERHETDDAIEVVIRIRKPEKSV